MANGQIAGKSFAHITFAPFLEVIQGVSIGCYKNNAIGHLDRRAAPSQNPSFYIFFALSSKVKFSFLIPIYFLFVDILCSACWIWKEGSDERFFNT